MRSRRPANAAASKRLRDERRSKLNSIKLSAGCKDCGFNSHPAALEFNHRDPLTKDFTISQSMHRSWSSLEAEIAKCDVLCSNCHHIHSYNNKHHAVRC
jgi:hypothetical protein